MLWLEGVKVVAVVRQRRVVGFVTAEDLASGPGSDDEALPIETFIGAAHPFLSWDDDRETALDLMTRLGISRLPVIGHRGRPWGIISLTDLLLHREGGADHSPSRTVAARSGERRFRTRVG
jgi:CBS domain-containing protein